MLMTFGMIYHSRNDISFDEISTAAFLFTAKKGNLKIYVLCKAGLKTGLWIKAMPKTTID